VNTFSDNHSEVDLFLSIVSPKAALIATQELAAFEYKRCERHTVITSGIIIITDVNSFPISGVPLFETSIGEVISIKLIFAT
jgi:hypothetical protein